jgi:hypothetical protein
MAVGRLDGRDHRMFFLSRSGSSKEIGDRSKSRGIHWIKHFIAIVETGSFTKGADRAAVTQSTISISIAKLEAEFGVQTVRTALASGSDRRGGGSVWSKWARQFYSYAVW